MSDGRLLIIDALGVGRLGVGKVGSPLDVALSVIVFTEEEGRLEVLVPLNLPV